MSKETAVATIETRYPVLMEDPATLMEALTQNLPGARLSPWDLTRWRFAGAEANAFKDNEGEQAKEIEGVIMAARAGQRGLYVERYQPGTNMPPDCMSSDGRTGNPDEAVFREKGLAVPSGKCGRGNCIYADFGSYKLIPGMQSPSGNAPACKERVIFLVIRPGSSIPCVVSLPSTALKAAKRYLLMRLGEKSLRPYEVETKITVRDGQVAFEIGDALPKESVEGIARLAEQFRADLEAMSAEDVTALGEEADAA